MKPPIEMSDSELINALRNPATPADTWMPLRSEAANRLEAEIERSAFYELDGEQCVDEGDALSELFLHEIVFVGGAGGPFFTTPADETTKKPATIHVNANDVFYWGSAYAIDLPMRKIAELYRYWKDGRYMEWCCIQENMQPQRPVREMLKECDKWTEALEALPRNPDDKS